jgi:Domain of Unknown Function with PDB structure (DUF3857)
MKYLFVCCCVLLSAFLFGCASVISPQSASIASRDVLYLEEGEEILGALDSVESGRLAFEDTQGKIGQWPLEKVQRVELAQAAGQASSLDQLNDPELAELIRTAPSPEDFPGRRFVTLLDRTEINIIDKGKVEVRKQKIWKILNEKGKATGSLNLSDFPDIGQLEIVKARSISPDGKVSDLPHTAVKEVWPNSRYDAYNRKKKIVFAIPFAEIGSVIELRTTATTFIDNDELPFVADESWAAVEPCLRKTLIFDRPRDSEYIVAQRNADLGQAWALQLQGGEKIYNKQPDGTLEVHAVEHEGRIQTTWTTGPIPVVVFQPYMPNLSDSIPMVHITRKRTWREVARSLWTEMEKRVELDAKVKEYVHGLTDGKPPEEAAHDLYNDLVYRIRKVKLSPGDYSYVPHSASEIFRTGYANNWDMTFLYYAMLREAGIKSKILAVRSWKWDNWEEKPPNINQFGSLVIEMNFGDRTVYAAARGSNNPFGQLSKSLWRGSTLLISDGKGTLGNLPNLPPGENEYTSRMLIEMKYGGNARVTEKNYWTGVSAFGTRWMKRKSKEYLEKYYEKQVRYKLPNAKLVTYKHSDRRNLDLPCSEELVYEVAPLGVISGGRYMVFRLPGTNYPPADAQEGERRFDLRLGEPWRQKRRFEIVMPKGIKLVSLPAAQVIKEPWGSFVRKVKRTDDNRIIVEDSTEYTAYEIPKSAWDSFREFRQKRQEIGQEYFVFDMKSD